MSLPMMTSTRTRAVVVVVTALVGIGVLSLTGMQESLVYYRTPTEVNQDGVRNERDTVRLGGLVVPDSVRRRDGVVRMRITDGASDVVVLHRGPLPTIFEEGQGAVVEGHLDGAGRFLSDRLMVKHSNEYRPPSEAAP